MLLAGLVLMLAEAIEMHCSKAILGSRDHDGAETGPQDASLLPGTQSSKPQMPVNSRQYFHLPPDLQGQTFELFH